MQRSGCMVYGLRCRVYGSGSSVQSPGLSVLTVVEAVYVFTVMRSGCTVQGSRFMVQALGTDPGAPFSGFPRAGLSHICRRGVCFDGDAEINFETQPKKPPACRLF